MNPTQFVIRDIKRIVSEYQNFDHNIKVLVPIGFLRMLESTQHELYTTLKDLLIWIDEFNVIPTNTTTGSQILKSRATSIIQSIDGPGPITWKKEDY